jgi:hypothetical protein
MRSLLSVILLASFSLISAGSARGGEKTAVGVLDLTGPGMSESSLRLLSDRLRVELFETGRFTVVERERMSAILKEQGFQQSGCVATECVIEAGQLIGVEKMVAGTIGKVGTVFTLSIRLLDVATGVMEKTAVRDCRCDIEDVLTIAIAQVASELSGIEAPGRMMPSLPTGLRISSRPPGATVILDGESVGVTPVVIADPGAGSHKVHLALRDHLPWDRSVEMPLGQRSMDVNATLLPCGYLTIVSFPRDASVSIDDSLVPPLKAIPIALGDHVVTGMRAGFDSATVRVSVTHGKRETIHFRLNARFGGISVTSTPRGASVHSVPLGISGVTPLVIDSLAPGDYWVEVSSPRRSAYSAKITVKKGELVRMKASLPWTPEVARERKTKMKRWVRLVSLGVGMAAAGVGYKYDRDAEDAYDLRETIHSEYVTAVTTTSVENLRRQADIAESRGNSAAKKRNVFYAIAGSSFGISFVLFAW